MELLLSEDEQRMRERVRALVDAQIMPRTAELDETTAVAWDVAAMLVRERILSVVIPEEYGGGGADDYRYNAILQEEAARALVTLGTARTQLDVILPYFLTYANAEQRSRWFPGMVAGELLTAIAMTEPDTGSDLAGARTTAVRDGEEYMLNGAKTFITGGLLADLVIVLARTSVVAGDRRAGLTLLVVEDGMPGFVKARKLDKLGCKVQDTAELSFTDVRVSAANRLGEEGKAFGYLGHNLPRERIAIAVGSVAQARAAVDATIEYVSARKVFGTTVSSVQNTKFELASAATEVEAGQALLDRAITALVAGELDGVEAAKTKLFCTEMQGRVVDRCLQLFGGYGYIMAFPIARLYADARVTRIYGGTSEVMKSIISKSLGL